MWSRCVVGVLAVTAASAALAGGASAAPTPSCVGQAASAPTTYPTEKADFVTSFAGPGYGELVSAFATFDRTACPPLPTPGG
jgi:hypothetical protein